MFLYKIFYNGVLLYVGSTSDIKKRKILHKSGLKNGVDRPLYRYLRENNINFEELIFEIIETDINNKNDLLKEEGIMIKELSPLCNKDIAGRTSEEYSKDYYENNLENIKEYQKKYRENNIKKIKEYYKKILKNLKKLIKYIVKKILRTINNIKKNIVKGTNLINLSQKYIIIFFRYKNWMEVLYQREYS